MSLSRLKPHAGFGLILLVYASLALWTSLQAPLSAGPDEVAHFMFARFLRQAGYLPLTPADREAAGYKSDQPPLNVALVALAAYPADVTAPPFVKLTHNLPRRHVALPVAEIPNWLALNTEDPWAGEILLWRIGHWLSILFSGATLGVIYSLALLIFEDFPARHLAATAAVMSVAFIPTFVFISSVLSYENLLGLWLALYLLIAVYLIKKSGPGWLFGLAGLCVGLAIVTKLGALTAPLSLLGLVGVVGFRAGWSKRKYLPPLVWSLLGLLLGGGWWFVWIELNLNRVKEIGWLAGLIYPILVADGSDSTSAEISYLLSSGRIGGLVNPPDRIDFYEGVERLFRSFWRFQWQYSTLLVWLLLGVTALVIIGLIRLWRQKPEARLWLVLLPAHVLIFFIFPLVRFFSIQQTSAVLGQHVLFPTVGALAILITWGLSVWFPARAGWPWLGGTLLGLGLLGWSLVQAGQLYESPLPVRTIAPDMPASAQDRPLDFGSIALLGYDLQGLTGETTCCDAAHPALNLRLYWTAQEVSQENYLTEIRLVNSQGETQSIWQGYAGAGRYPTKAWDPGDMVRDETWLPILGLTPGAYSLKLRLLAAHGPLSLGDVNEFTLAQVELAEPGVSSSAAQASNQFSFNIWQQGQMVSGLLTFETRSTIQITAISGVTVSLVGPNGVAWPPAQTGGQTRVFIVDPRWPKGDYRIRFEVKDQPAWESEPFLLAQGEGRPTEPPASQTRLQTNFANQLALLGYDLPQRRLMPGDSLPITLNWQALQSMPADFIMFTRLRDQAGKIWGGYDRRPREVYSTLLWEAGEVVADSFTLPIKGDVPPGLYNLDVGFYLPVGQAPVSLPLVQEGKLSQTTSVTLGPIKVGHAPAGLVINSAQPQNKLNQPFGNPPNLTLLGYDLNSTLTDTFQLTLYWRCESPAPLDYTAFIHVRNAAGETVAQKDQPPLNGVYPTSLWDPGEIIADTINVPLPALPPAGIYHLVIGLYDFQTGQRLAVPGNSAHEVSLTNVDIR